MADEGEVIGAEVGIASSTPPVQKAAAAMQGIQLAADEKLVVRMNRDGGLEGMEVKGDLQLLISEGALGKVTIPLRMGANPGFQFKTHPNINKALFTSNSVLGLKDPARPFPTGSPLGVLKWRLQTTDESLVPLVINCWPTQTAGDSFEINVEYELTASAAELRDVLISIPCTDTNPPTLTADADNGQATYSKRDAAMQWTIPLVDSSSSSANIEFTVTGASSPDVFFPITVNFSSVRTLCELEAPQVLSAEDSSPVPFSSSCAMSVESYTIV